ASSAALCTPQPCTASIRQPHAKLLSQQARLREMRYVWGQMSLPTRPPAASSSKTLERVWFAGCRWWQLHALKL
ncbi:MAG TPA: hypothetical protein V6C57_22770, partial [Coleofasciculaceae cyanobacterium]